MAGFDAGSILAKMRLDISQWEKSARKINEDQKRIAGQTKKTTSAMKGMWKQMAIGMGVTNLVTMGIRGMMRQMSDTIKTGRTFEREWANVTTMLDISRSATEKMKHELRMLSPTLGDTTELAKGMYQVLSASIEPAKAIRFLGEAAKSAKAGVTETKVAVDALTTVINAYGLEAEDVTDVSDIMFATVKKGKLTYEELAHSLGTVVPVAATVGVEFKEIAAATATLTRQGIQASKATMQLRQVMMSVLKPSEQAREIAEGLGIELGASALEARGLSGFLFDLKEKTKGNADLMAKLVPNVRALTAVMALAGEQADAFAGDIEFMGEAVGLTDEAFRKQFESIDAWIEVAETAADKIKIAFYEGLIYSLRESIRTAEDFDEKVTERTNSAANAVSLHVSTMVDMLGGLGKAWKATDEFLFGWIDRLRGAKEGGKELADATVILKGAMAEGDVEIIKAAEDTEALKEAAAKAAFRINILSRASRIYGGILEELSEFEGIWDALIPPSEAIARWEEFYNLVETPELDLIWEQQMVGMEEDTLAFMASIIPGMAFVTDEIKENFKSMAKDVKMSTSDIATAAGSMLTSLAGKNKGLAIAGAIISTYAGAAKTIELMGMPLAIPFVAMAIAAGLKQVKAIKAQEIPSAEEGGWIPKPALIEAGHGGGEVILPLDRAPLKEIFHETAGVGGMTIDFNFYAPIISTTGLSERDIDGAAEYFLEKMKAEIGRYGGKLNG